MMIANHLAAHEEEMVEMVLLVVTVETACRDLWVPLVVLGREGRLVSVESQENREAGSHTCGGGGLLVHQVLS